MNRILSIVVKEFLQIRRDRRMLPIIFISPVLQLLLLGYAANIDVKEVPVLICDLDGTAESRALAKTLSVTGDFAVSETTRSLDRVDAALDEGKAQIALIVPRGYGADIQAGKTARLQIAADGSDANSAGIGLNYLISTLADYSKNLFVERLKRTADADASRTLSPQGFEDGDPELFVFPPAGVTAVSRVWYNPDLRSRYFFVPGILALLLMVMTMLLTSLAIVKEKEKGTLEQLIVTPLRSVELIIGKLIPFIIIGFIDVLLVLLAARLLFGLRVEGSIPLLFGLSALFLLTTLGLGLFISTISRTQQQAMMTSVFFVLMPMIFLSGFVFPIDTMPAPIQALSYLIPMRYYIVIIRGIFLKGAGIAALWDEALLLGLFGTVILGFSVLRFKKRLE